MTAQIQTLDNEVLFQKLGKTWYIFTEISGDFVYSALPNGMNPHTTKLELYDVIEEHMVKVAKNKNIDVTSETAA